MVELKHLQQLNAQVTSDIEKLNEHYPEIQKSYLQLQDDVLEDGYVSRKDKELILVGINAARRYEKGMIHHTKRAIDSGATIHELVETLTPCILSRGIPAWLEGIKAIDYAQDYLGEKDVNLEHPGEVSDISTIQEALDYFKTEANGQKPNWVSLLQSEAEHVLLHYGQLRSSILKDGYLERKMKEFTLIGINVAEQYEEGVRLHVNAAKKLGATPEELAEVALTATLTAGIPAWFEISEYL
ncbi:carboxymuconolactone decarboxylase family protein [Aquisalibacillus elongatus]|nr:carboxymuconolactone decarboxylase family protein [Aquisalibacillus elongatus]